MLRLGVPDIDLLLGRSVPSAPQLDAGAVHLRLFQAILSLLRRQDRPLLLVLEGLHWARAETLDLLAALTRELVGLRILLVASYRQDEAPQLFAEVPDIERLSIGRLDRAGIEAIDYLWCTRNAAKKFSRPAVICNYVGPACAAAGRLAQEVML